MKNFQSSHSHNSHFLTNYIFYKIERLRVMMKHSNALVGCIFWSKVT